MLHDGQRCRIWICASWSRSWRLKFWLVMFMDIALRWRMKGSPRLWNNFRTFQNFQTIREHLRITTWLQKLVHIRQLTMPTCFFLINHKNWRKRIWKTTSNSHQASSSPDCCARWISSSWAPICHAIPARPYHLRLKSLGVKIHQNENIMKFNNET